MEVATLRAGLLDRRIVLQRNVYTLSSSGDKIDSWSTLSTRWASLNPLSGDERNAAQQWIAKEQVKFTVRWSADISDLSPLDRIIFPASDVSESPIPTRSTYDVMAVMEEGRQEGLIILAARQP